MRRLDGIAQGLGFALGLVAFSPVAATGEPMNSACLVDAMDAQSLSLSLLAENTFALPLKLLSAGQGLSANLDPVCAGDRLASLGLRLMPGQTLSVTLLTRSDVSVPLQVTESAVRTDDEQIGAWEVSLRRPETGTNPQSAQLIELVVTAGENNRRGQRQSFQLFGKGHSDEGQQGLSLELNLESLDSERMFRDNFTVDPSVGQFSQRSQRHPDTTEGRSVQGAASSTL